MADARRQRDLDALRAGIRAGTGGPGRLTDREGDAVRRLVDANASALFHVNGDCRHHVAEGLPIVAADRDGLVLADADGRFELASRLFYGFVAAHGSDAGEAVEHAFVHYCEKVPGYAEEAFEVERLVAETIAGLPTDRGAPGRRRRPARAAGGPAGRRRVAERLRGRDVHAPDFDAEVAVAVADVTRSTLGRMTKRQARALAATCRQLLDALPPAGGLDPGMRRRVAAAAELLDALGQPKRRR
jgi:hypothetical protein